MFQRKTKEQKDLFSANLSEKTKKTQTLCKEEE